MHLNKDLIFNRFVSINVEYYLDQAINRLCNMYCYDGTIFNFISDSTCNWEEGSNIAFIEVDLAIGSYETKCVA